MAALATDTARGTVVSTRAGGSGQLGLRSRPPTLALALQNRLAQPLNPESPRLSKLGLLWAGLCRGHSASAAGCFRGGVPGLAEEVSGRGEDVPSLAGQGGTRPTCRPPVLPLPHLPEKLKVVSPA